LRDGRTITAAARIAAPVALLVAAASLMAIAAGGPDAFAAKLGQRSLKPGMRGKDVRILQRSLTRLKLPTPVTGRYATVTKQNVRLLERRRGWRVDGRVGRRQAKRIRGLVRALLARKRARRRASAVSASYVFPVGDPHDFGGSAARFGAPRSGYAHQGQDVFAPCGTRMFAAHAGNVKARAYQSGGAGYYLVIDGLDGSDTVYMHMRKASWATLGTLLYPGQQIGKVGQTGNASGCHLHFEHWTSPGWYAGGFPVDPLAALLSWDSYS